MTAILLATRNRHKAEEVQALLEGSCCVLTFNDLPGAPAVAEDAPTFEGNAKKKALALAQWLAQRPLPAALERMPPAGTFYTLADDSGLEVDFLNGAPGVHSARFAALDVGGGNSPDAANNAKLLRLLEGVDAGKRTARFRCVLALARLAYSEVTRRLAPITEASLAVCQGTCEGRIAETASGRRGFGYDPLFIPKGQTASFAELGEDVKNKISHRARAMAQLRSRLK